MRIIIFHIRLKVVFAKSILIQQLSFLFPKFFCFFLLRVFQLLFNFLILLRSFEFAQFLQLRMNYRIIDLSTNFKAFFKAVGLPLFQFKRQREATSICATPFHECPSPSFAFPPHYTASSAHFQARTANSTFIRCFFTVQSFLYLSSSPIYPPFHSSRSENVLNCEKNIVKIVSAT